MGKTQVSWDLLILWSFLFLLPYSSAIPLRGRKIGIVLSEGYGRDSDKWNKEEFKIENMDFWKGAGLGVMSAIADEYSNFIM